jgi:outer membrane lipoprotein-sorting protein
MRPLSPSTRKLSVLAAVVALLAVTAGIAQATRDDGGPKPPARPLATAVMSAVQQVGELDGVSADVTFTNNLIPPGTLPAGARTPLTSGAGGKLWLAAGGRFRLALRSDDGDLEVVGDGRRVRVWDKASNTEYRVTLATDLGAALRGGGGGGGNGGAAAGAAGPGGVAAIASLGKALGPLLDQVTISGAKPDTVGGRPAYTVRVAPKDDGGLLAAGEISWDAEHGMPLRAAVYAQGKDEPVLELALSHVDYGRVPADRLAATPHTPAKTIDLDEQAAADAHRGLGAGSDRPAVTGLAEVRRRVSFPVAAPDELAGLPRSGATLAADGSDSGVVLTYGKGLGSIVVVEWPSRRQGPLAGLPLPEVNIDGATGQELATALGTMVTFDHAGVSYLVAGLVPPVAAENAARALR